MGHPRHHRFWLWLNRRRAEFQANQQTRHHQHQDTDTARDVDHIDRWTRGAREETFELHGAVGDDD